MWIFYEMVKHEGLKCLGLPIMLNVQHGSGNNDGKINFSDCSSGYNIRSYHQYEGVNTQVAEQPNSVIGRLRSMLSYTNEENFSKYLKLFLWFRNTLHLLKLRPPKDEVEENIKELLSVYTKKR